MPPTPAELRAEPVLISAAVNTFSQCLAWAHPEQEQHDDEAAGAAAVVVAYGAHHWVALATAPGEVRHALRGHAGTVQCVEWLTPGRELASGSADGTVRVWRRGHSQQQEEKWGCTHVLKPTGAGPALSSSSSSPSSTSSPPQPVSRLAALQRPNGAGIFLAAATAGGVTLWHGRGSDDDDSAAAAAGGAEGWQVVLSTPTPAVQIPTALALVPLGRDAWALLVGAVDARIHVWTGAFVAAAAEPAATTMEWRRLGALVGHQGWIRSLAWRPLAGGGDGVWIASGAQDGKIRLWKVEGLEDGKAAAAAAPAAEEGGSAGEEEEEEEGGATDEEEDDHEVRLVLEATGQRRRFGVRLDALLVGHEDWVTGVCWHPPRGGGSSWPLALLSCSMDRSLIIWRPEGARGVWTPRVRLGDLGADLGGAVGSNLLGFLGCAFDARGGTVLGHGFGGSMHAYRLEGEEEEEDGEGGLWRPVPFATGHFEEVSDVQWERWRGGGARENDGGAAGGLGRYLVSASKDQTTRLWAAVTVTGPDPGAGAGPGKGRRRRHGRWHEVSRVQVHGYDLACLDLLPHVAHRLVSGADEKTLRVFDATAKVLGLLQELCGLPPPQGAAAGGRVETAYMQALALSAKAVVGAGPAAGQPEQEQEQGLGLGQGHGEAGEDAAALERARARVSWAGRGPPLEGELVDHTLWPEVAKLYGHGNGLTCLAADHAGRLVASACKARDPETARVRLWDTATWRALAGEGGGPATLPGHQSTVVQLAFSHDDRVLASVSKDRQVCLYARKDDDGGGGGGSSSGGEQENGAAHPGYCLAQTLTKAHKRIVWSCSWSHDDALLATGSRDGSFKLWRRPQQQQQEEGGSTILFPEPLATLRPAAAGGSAARGPAAAAAAGSGGGAESVTAVAFAPRLLAGPGADADGRYLLAVGLDSGDIELWAGRKDDGASWACLLRFGGSLPHAATVKRLRWRPSASAAASEGGVLELASCGSDHAVKVARVLT
jgi:elongator complex protein 2